MGRAESTEKEKNVKATAKVKPSSGNVFADLGLDHPEELNAKARIAYRICQLLEGRNLTQMEAATLLGVDQPKVSALMHGRLDGFSSDRLFRFLTALNQDVEIVIKKAPKKAPAAVRVRAYA